MVDTSEEAQAATTSPAPSINGVGAKATSPHHHHASDSDAQEMLISSLRSQIQDLFSQVTQLNGKLVKSYDRVSDLEDDLHTASAQGRQATLKISQLELERTQHLSALNTGLLVEKTQVTAELTRLMEKATEEAAQRGQAETAKANIEKDLDDLSATLFAQANTMVAEARYGQSLSERRVEQAETALKGAEEMVSLMQQQMQALQAEKDEAERKAQSMRVMMGKGKWVDRSSGSSAGALVKETRLLSSHLPYQEFLLFVAHLRSVHSSTPSPPAMTTLLTMPFLARLSSEDSEPTVRLDLAPSLNWLSRRSVLAAIHAGQLTIEPMSSNSLLSDSTSGSGASTIPGLNSSNTNISCALCGTPIFSTPEVPHTHTRPPTHPAISGANTNINSWSASVIKKTLAYTTPNGSPTPPPRSLSRPLSQAVALHAAPYPPQIYVFRIAAALPPAQPTVPPTRTASPSPFLPSVGTSRVPAPPPPQNTTTSALTSSLSALGGSTQSPSPVYPLCTSGWCLTRLRATCTLWAFVRTGIVERVWEEEVPTLPQPAQAANGAAGSGAPPPVPPRRRGLWGMASKLGERAASWSADGGKDKKAEVTPTPPPVQSTNSAPSRPTTPAPAPPLPKRSEGRSRRPTVSMGSGAPPIPPRGVPPPLPPVLVPESHPETAAAPPQPADSKNEDAPAEPQPPAASTPDADANIELPNPHDHPELPNPYGASPIAAHPAAGVAALKSEALAKQNKRMSAHQVPLPDSRPGTPRPATPTLVDGASAAADATPAPAAGAGAGAPPPLPRRAAARRPVPPVPGPPVPGTPSRAESPAPAPVATSRAQSPAPAPPASEAPIAEQAEKVSAPEVAEKSEPPVVDAAAALKAKAEEAPNSVVAEEGSAEAQVAAEERKEAQPLKADEQLKAIDEAPPRVDSPVANGHVDDDDEEELHDAKEHDDEDGHEVYVGDVTWEERTWKDLVRLREDLFWARIGGIRSH